MRSFIDAAVGGSPLAFLTRLGLIFLIAALGQQGIAIGSTYYTQHLGWSATNALREDLTQHALNLNMRFHKAHPPGEMISRIDSDITTLNDFFSQFLLNLLANFLLVLTVLIVLYLEDWRIGLVLTGFALVALLVLTQFRNIAVPHWEAERKAEANFFSFLEERLNGTVDIRANGGRSYTLQQFFAHTQEMYQRSIKAGFMVNYMLNAMFLVFALGTAISLGVSGSLYLNGALSIGTVYIVYQYNRMLETPLEEISRQLSNIQKSLASIKRVFELFDQPTEITATPPDSQIESLPQESGPLAVKFDHVSFFYDDQDEAHVPVPLENVLKEIDFSLNPGEVLGLLGRTGSGKTTLTRLLFRLYNPQTGKIHIGPTQQRMADIQHIPLTLLRRRIGMVTQNIELFHASVRDNLTFFDRSIPDERILDVIRRLGLGNWFSRLSGGLDAVLPSGGGGLSAGEAQLLAFTRVFLHDPGLIVLDEASSRLDPATEALVESAVVQLLAGRTALIIAHRLKTLEIADKIMILENGCMVEYGDRLALAQNPQTRFHNLLRTGLDEVLT
jgi:ATP-binding cassette subfamily B protein